MSAGLGRERWRLSTRDAPATVWNPRLTGASDCAATASTKQVRSEVVSEYTQIDPKDEDLAFAPVWQLSRQIQLRKLTSERLTKIYIERLKRFQPKLNCVITLCEEHALEQAR